MNVEIGAEAALFPGKEYIIGISVAVCSSKAQVYHQNKGFFWQSGIKILRPANLLQFSERRALPCVCPSVTVN